MKQVYILLLLFFCSISVWAQPPTPWLKTGSYVGNEVVRTISGMGFDPDVVIIKSATTNDGAYIRTSTMPVGYSKKMIGGNSSYDIDHITGFTANGFSLSDSREVNQIGADLYYIAFDTAAGYIVTGTYDGDGQPTQQITGIGFLPEYVIVIPENTAGALQRSKAMAEVPINVSADTTRCADFGTDGLVVNAIISLDSDGFTVATGIAPNVNNGNVKYHYVAFRAGPGIKSGYYSGNGQDSVCLPIGHDPDYLTIKAVWNSYQAIHRTWDMPPNANLGFGDDADDRFEPNEIRQFCSDGIIIGDRNDVNHPSRDYVYMSFDADLHPSDTVCTCIQEICDSPGDEDGDGLVNCADVDDCQPDTAGPILNPAGCVGDTMVYSVPAVTSSPSVSQYNWTVPGNATIHSGQGTTSIEVIWSSSNTSGEICVTTQTSAGCQSPQNCVTVSITAPPVLGPIEEND